MVKNPPVNSGDMVQSPRHKDPLEEGMATHSSILAWRISRTEKPGGLQSMESQGTRDALATKCQQKVKIFFKNKKQTKLISPHHSAMKLKTPFPMTEINYIIFKAIT